jgi:hypothetical protein
MQRSALGTGVNQAAEIRDLAKERWRSKKAATLESVEKEMVRRYVLAAALGHRRASTKLAYYTDVLGDAQMRDYVTRTPDPSDPSKKLTYTPNMYVNRRDGLHAATPVVLFAPPAPAPSL